MRFTGILQLSGAAYVSLLNPTVKPCSVHVTVTKGLLIIGNKGTAQGLHPRKRAGIRRWRSYRSRKQGKLGFRLGFRVYRVYLNPNSDVPATTAAGHPRV